MSAGVRRLLPCLLAAVFAAATSACSKHDEHAEIPVVEVQDIPKEVQIPSGVWDRIEGKVSHGADEGHGESAGAADADAGRESGGVLFMPVDVILTEKNPGVLKEPAVKIRLPRGGGRIDLNDYVASREGSFFVRFEWPEVEDPKGLKAWFVSKARKRRIGDELWGAGCRALFDVTKGLQKAMTAGGLKVNTTRNRHLTVLGGHFVFSNAKNGQTFAAQVTLMDSRRPELYCEEL